MGTYDLSSVTDLGQPQQVTYMHGDQRLSAFVFVGYDIVEARLPAGSSELPVRGGPWIVSVDRSRVVLAQVGSNAVVLVGPIRPRRGGPPAHSPDPSLMDRIEGAGEGLLEAFGLADLRAARAAVRLSLSAAVRPRCVATDVAADAQWVSARRRRLRTAALTFGAATPDAVLDAVREPH